MSQSWVTTASKNIEAMMNSLNAACNEGFVPVEIHVIEMPDVKGQVDQALAYASGAIEQCLAGQGRTCLAERSNSD